MSNYSQLREDVRRLRELKYDRTKRREILQDPQKRELICSPSQQERGEEEIRWTFYRWTFRLSALAGVGAAAYTGQLRWIPIGLAIGIGVPIGMGIMNHIGEVISEPWD